MDRQSSNVLLEVCIVLLHTTIVVNLLWNRDDIFLRFAKNRATYTNIQIGRSLIKLFKYKEVIRNVRFKNVVHNSILATKMPNRQFKNCQNSQDFWQCHHYILNHYATTTTNA